MSQHVAQLLKPATEIVALVLLMFLPLVAVAAPAGPLPQSSSSKSQPASGPSVCCALPPEESLVLPRASADETATALPPAEPSGQLSDLDATPKLFVRDILRDQKTVWQFPLGLAHGRHWKPALALAAGTAALVELDPHDTPYFRRTQTFADFNSTFSGVHTGLGEGLFPVAFFLAGRARHSPHAEETAVLAGEALVDAEIVSEVFKNVDRRLRPSEVAPNGDFADTWFKAGGGILIDRGSFPSGHSIGAFAMATVFAERYRQHRWVPWVAYGLAGLVGFSRITLQAHFPSDIFAGAALGYTISHYVVLRRQ